MFLYVSQFKQRILFCIAITDWFYNREGKCLMHSTTGSSNKTGLSFIKGFEKILPARILSEVSGLGLLRDEQSATGPPR